MLVRMKSRQSFAVYDADGKLISGALRLTHMRTQSNSLGRQATRRSSR